MKLVTSSSLSESGEEFNVCPLWINLLFFFETSPLSTVMESLDKIIPYLPIIIITLSHTCQTSPGPLMLYSKSNLFSFFSKLSVQTGHRDLTTFMSVNNSLFLTSILRRTLESICCTVETSFQNQNICWVWGSSPSFSQFLQCCTAGYWVLGFCVFDFTFLSSALHFSSGSLMLLVSDHFSHLSRSFWIIIQSSVLFVSLPSLMPWTYIITVLLIPSCCINEYIAGNLIPGKKYLPFEVLSQTESNHQYLLSSGITSSSIMFLISFPRSLFTTSSPTALNAETYTL